MAAGAADRAGHRDAAGRETDEQPAHPGDQLGRVDGLHLVVVRACPKTAHLGGGIVGAEQDDRHVRLTFGSRADLAQQRPGVETGHIAVDDREVGWLVGPQRQCLVAVRDDAHLAVLALEGGAQETLEPKVIGHDKDQCSHRRDAMPTGLRIGAADGPGRPYRKAYGWVW